jgi:hypothetical protein
MPGRSSVPKALLIVCALCIGVSARAQPVTGAVERLSPDRPEAWAMNYFTASSFMTGFGATPALRPGRQTAAVELGHIPHLDAEQRQVGFSGFKEEDLNKSPVIGRLR